MTVFRRNPDWASNASLVALPPAHEFVAVPKNATAAILIVTNVIDSLMNYPFVIIGFVEIVSFALPRIG